MSYCEAHFGNERRTNANDSVGEKHVDTGWEHLKVDGTRHLLLFGPERFSFGFFSCLVRESTGYEKVNRIGRIQGVREGSRWWWPKKNDAMRSTFFIVQ